MLIKLPDSGILLQGRLDKVRGQTVCVDLEGKAYRTQEVEFAIPDDEAQAAEIVAAGFRVHTPLSMVLKAL